MKIALLGYGTVGAGVDELIGQNSALQNVLQITGIFSRSYRPAMGGRFLPSFDDVLQGDYDTVLELIGGEHPAYEYVKSALSSGKHVVTANKAVIAAHYPELSEIALEHGVSLLFSASAGGGIPWLKNLFRAGETDTLNSIRGVMNGTTNYILDEMTEKDESYGSALLGAQKAGYAEADPTSDVEGHDTRRKLAVSLFVGLGVFVEETSIPVFGISGVSKEDVRAAKELGAVLRLVGQASRTSGGISAFVAPVFVPEKDLFAALHGADNAFSYEAKSLGPQCFTGAGAGRYPTAANVIRDLVDLASTDRPVPPVSFTKGRVVNTGTYRFYVREKEQTGIVTSTIDALKERYEGKQDVFIALMP